MCQPKARRAIYTIPPSVPFLPRLVETLVDGTLVDGFRPLDDPLLLADVTLYLPTRRAARQLPDLFQEVFKGKPVLLPRILPVGDADEDLDAFFLEGDGEPLPPAIAPIERHLAMTRLVMAWKSALRREVLQIGSDEPLGVPASPADAAWLAGDLLALMDEIETEEANWSGLAGLVPEDHARYWQVTLEFLEIVHKAWPGFLAERGRMDPKKRRSDLIRRSAKRLVSQPPRGPVIVAGVTGSIPATAELLKSISKLPQGVLVFPGLDLHLDEVSWNLLAEHGAGNREQDRQVQRPSSQASHPQYSLNQVVRRINISRSDVASLGEPPDKALSDRDRIVSEAMRPADTSDRWNAFKSSPAANVPAAFEHVGVILARNETEEALAVSIALRHAVERGETAMLVSPDRMLTRRVAAELARWKIQVDDSAGRPLDQTPPGILTLLVAKLAVNGCNPIDLLSLLKHPLCRLGLSAKDIRSAARALERGVLRGPMPHPGTNGLLRAVDAAKLEAEAATHVPRWKKIHEADWDVLKDLIVRLQRALAPLEGLVADKGKRPATALAEANLDALKRIAEDEHSSHDELFAGETGDALAAFFVGLLEAGNAGLDLTVEDWPTVLPALMAGSSVRRRLPGDPRVQILGPMEARLQTADCVILAGLNEGTWPQRTRNDPWLNRLMKQDLGLDPPERRIGAAAHDFVQCMGGKRVLISRALRADGAPTVASRLLQRLTTLVGPDVTAQLEKRGQVYCAYAAAIDRPATPIRPAERPSPVPPLEARPVSLSVTEIERLIRDPYAIYARHVLDLQEVEPIGGVPGAADKGILIHAALAKFLKEWPGPFDQTAVDALLEIGDRLFRPLDAFPAIRALWWPRFERVAKAFVDFEAKRAPRISTRHLEVGGGLELALPGFSFRLRGRADRIDVKDDGTVAVIDYKTGQAPSLKQVESLLAPQMPLEAALVSRGGFSGLPAGQTVSELLYVQLKGGAEPLLELPRNPREKDLGDFIGEAWARLESLIAYYGDETTGYLSRARVFQERQVGGTYDHLARVQEWTAGGGEEE
ncbi:ATP-dependent helicase/nuclease subunit B [Roseibium hamelinense]|uniref:ATP-dependent helicase/nuclease subunit B n=1 Tax=Roseibium hamelinense TaxID=150831 RepID=A0A562T342_9HYPH|nr:double-strand break repair protein AddB [Roseibium hamelinense]MTI44564.1 double-strand break repair protein AddB [Roseibium hamelinense]TWI87190.1 ATP-dependent helicase/nuclease subunit B [Roseibium hamelinense]